ncbi:MAG: CHRD domain-containing protein [Balneolales bacterium]
MRIDILSYSVWLLLPLAFSVSPLKTVAAQDADFIVTVEAKDLTHPNYENAHETVYVINGEQGKELTLYRGATYTFDVNAIGHPFFLATQPGGGTLAGEITEGVDNSRVQDGILTFTPGEDLPDEIYYECDRHTNMGGVIQLLDFPEPEFTEFHAHLSGLHEFPPVLTTATGEVNAELEGYSLIITGSFQGLSSPVQPPEEAGAHIHTGHAGSIGSVAASLNPSLSDGDTAGDLADTVTLSPEHIEMLGRGELYINIHSEDYPSGEIRGQLLRSPNNAPNVASEITYPGNEDTIVLDGDSIMFSPRWTPSGEPDDDRLVYIWQLALGQDFDEIIFAVSAGEDTTFSITHSELNEVLASQGVEDGQLIAARHRILASDGSLYHTGPGSSVTFERGTLTSSTDEPAIARFHDLQQNYPNPFNPVTVIRYDLPEPNEVRLEVFDLLGRPIATLVHGRQQAGTHQAVWDGSGQASGIYIYRLRAGDYVQTRRMTLIK